MEFLKVLSPVVYDRTHLYRDCLSFVFFFFFFFSPSKCVAALNVLLRFYPVTYFFGCFALMTAAILLFQKTAGGLVRRKQKPTLGGMVIRKNKSRKKNSAIIA